jgi:hypothetical protein
MTDDEELPEDVVELIHEEVTDERVARAADVAKDGTVSEVMAKIYEEVGEQVLDWEDSSPSPDAVAAKIGEVLRASVEERQNKNTEFTDKEA